MAKGKVGGKQSLGLKDGRTRRIEISQDENGYWRANALDASDWVFAGVNGAASFVQAAQLLAQTLDRGIR